METTFKDKVQLFAIRKQYADSPCPQLFEKVKQAERAYHRKQAK